MEEEVIILLSSEIVRQLTSIDNDRLELLEKTLTDNRQVITLISSYYNGAQVSYHIKSMEVDDQGEGYLYVNYTVHRYSGCNDVDKSSDDDMSIDIQIDLETGRAVLTGEFIPERGPDEY